MSYNNRRSGNFNSSNNVGSIGQRRQAAPANIQNNFVSGGQITPQKKPAVQPSMQQQQMQQQPQQRTPQQTQMNLRGQQQQKPPVQQPQQQQMLLQQQQQQKPVQQPQKPIQAKVEPMDVIKEDPLMKELDNAAGGKKGFWANKKTVKISKKEKQRRRNIRLSKMLQPKNAVMILNELVQNPPFVISDLTIGSGQIQYQAIVNVDNKDHVGVGKSKHIAKNLAAENAIKHLVKHKRLTEMKKEEDDAESSMEVEGETEDAPLPWQHVASLALFKLFTDWGEDVKAIAKPADENGAARQAPGTKPELKPAKKMPPNPEQMQPMMLLNQMVPYAEYTELGKTGVPPNVNYTYQCTVDGMNFQGTGKSKKIAKKMAAYGACNVILSINYPADVYTPPASI